MEHTLDLIRADHTLDLVVYFICLIAGGMVGNLIAKYWGSND
jgi:hypothetical protein